MTQRNGILFLSFLLILSLLLSSCGESIITTPSSPTDTATLTPSTNTVTLEPTSIPLPTPTPAVKTYIVQKGDTLWKISQMFGIPVTFIAIQNKIDNADIIYPGETLIIPESADEPPITSTVDKEIVVILSLQKLYAYENNQLINDFLVSTGVVEHPTVLGEYQIYVKYPSTRMAGPGYDLPDVPWTMYFYEDYGIHGTYWHNNFGVPMSHGCVNMAIEDAEWLYNWAPVGTTVLIIE